jgi:tetratricopeptide (TPR) repeat protein
VATTELPDIEPGDLPGSPQAPAAPRQDDEGVEEGIGDGLHQALYSIDFQLEYGSPFDAKVEIEQALLRYPGNAELARRLSIVDARLDRRPPHAEQGSPGLLAFPAVLDAAAAPPQATDEANDDTGAFSKVRTAEEIYGAFKDEVERLVGLDDPDTSYNLGIGYREMGLIEPAIEEFKKAMRDPRRRLECCSMIAMCEEARGDFAAAMEWLRRGIGDRGFAPTDSAGMKRELALLMERAEEDGAGG